MKVRTLMSALAFCFVAAVCLAQNPHIAYTNTTRRGYMLVTAQRDELKVEFRSPATTQSPASDVSTLARFSVASGSRQLTQT